MLVVVGSNLRISLQFTLFWCAKGLNMHGLKHEPCKAQNMTSLQSLMGGKYNVLLSMKDGANHGWLNLSSALLFKKILFEHPLKQKR
jgi:hypothetical protein